MHELAKNAQTFCDRPVMVRVLPLWSRMWTINSASVAMRNLRSLLGRVIVEGRVAVCMWIIRTLINSWFWFHTS